MLIEQRVAMLAIASWLALASTALAQTPPGKDSLESLATPRPAERTDTQDLVDKIGQAAEDYCAKRKEVTLVVGVTQQGKRYVKGFRSPDAVKAVLPDVETVYEIGSITKVLTCIILARLEADGLVAVDDSIAEHLPQDLKLPPEVAAITLLQLATHTSGLPRVADNFEKLIQEDAHTWEGRGEYYAKYKKEDLYEDLRTVKLTHKPGTQWEYSVIGMGTLGHILELQSGESYETLVQEIICGPLDMKDTTTTLSKDQRNRMAIAYDSKGTPVPPWEFDVLGSQGAIRSTMKDMLTFAEANLKADDTELSAAMRNARQALFDGPGFGQGLGWWKFVMPKGDAWVHDGATGAYRAFLGICEKPQVGLVLLSSNGKTYRT
jgi:CubicO group peptidase (beta-lactamase class C family)